MLQVIIKRVYVLFGQFTGTELLKSLALPKYLEIDSEVISYVNECPVESL